MPINACLSLNLWFFPGIPLISLCISSLLTTFEKRKTPTMGMVSKNREGSGHWQNLKSRRDGMSLFDTDLLVISQQVPDLFMKRTDNLTLNADGRRK